MGSTADELERFAGKLQHYVDGVEQANLDIKRLVADLGEHFGGALHDKFESEFSSEIHEPMIPLTTDLRVIHGGLVTDIEFVRRLDDGDVNA